MCLHAFESSEPPLSLIPMMINQIFFFSKTVKNAKNVKKDKFVIKKHLFYDENDLLMISNLKYPISHGKRMIP